MQNDLAAGAWLTFDSALWPHLVCDYIYKKNDCIYSKDDCIYQNDTSAQSR